MKWIKKLLGVDKVEESLAVAQKALQELEEKKDLAEKAAKKATEAEEVAKLSPKDRATRKKNRG